MTDPGGIGGGPRGMKVLAGNSNSELAKAIAAHLKLPSVKAIVRRFADMEVFVEIQENVRGEDVFVIQSTSFPANDNLMELLGTLDALRRSPPPQAGRQPDPRGRPQPRPHHGPACRPDSGLFRYPGGQSRPRPVVQS